MNIQNINSETYTIEVSDTSASATLTKSYGHSAKAIITNLSTNAAFVAAGPSAFDAVFPTSATSPLRGQVIPPLSVMSYNLSANDTVISAIQLSTGTGNLYITIDPNGGA